MISTNRKSPKKKKYVAAVYMRARVSEELANHLITSFPFFKKFTKLGLPQDCLRRKRNLPEISFY